MESFHDNLTENYAEQIKPNQFVQNSTEETYEKAETSKDEGDGLNAKISEVEDDEDRDEKRKNLKRKLDSPIDNALSVNNKIIKTESAGTSLPTPEISGSVDSEATINTTDTSSLSITEENASVKCETEKDLILPKCKIFANKEFIITHAVSVDSGTDQSRPFWVQHVLKQIEHGGGYVDEYVDDMLWSAARERMRTNVYLVTDSYSPPTPTFLTAVVVGIPCVKHHWIDACCSESKLLNHRPFLLPIGKTILTKSVMQWHNCRRIFRGFSLAIESHNVFSKEYHFWTDLVTYAGGKVVKLDQISPLGHGAALLIDNSYTAAEIRALKVRKIPLVNTDWVVECLFVGHRINWLKSKLFTWNTKV